MMEEPKFWRLLTVPERFECLHLKCEECHGTGWKKDRTPCIHMLSCRCSKCSPVRL